MIFKTVITDIGPDVAELVHDGVLILFAEGAPPELAEVSVLHAIHTISSDREPVAGDAIVIGSSSVAITAVGPLAWQKVRDMGHVVITFSGASIAERPGEICTSPVDGATLMAALKVGAIIQIG